MSESEVNRLRSEAAALLLKGAQSGKLFDAWKFNWDSGWNLSDKEILRIIALAFHCLGDLIAFLVFCMLVNIA